jgi:hypothetical protein
MHSVAVKLKKMFIPTFIILLQNMPLRTFKRFWKGRLNGINQAIAYSESFGRECEGENECGQIEELKCQNQVLVLLKMGENLDW